MSCLSLECSNSIPETKPYTYIAPIVILKLDLTHSVVQYIEINYSIHWTASKTFKSFCEAGITSSQTSLRYWDWWKLVCEDRVYLCRDQSEEILPHNRIQWDYCLTWYYGPNTEVITITHHRGQTWLTQKILKIFFSLIFFLNVKMLITDNWSEKRWLITFCCATWSLPVSPARLSAGLNTF